MASIYANAYFTIAATNSGDASGGCFRNTSDKYVSKLLPGYKDTYVRHKLPKFPYMSNEHEIGNSPEWPLLSRGWAYQEIRLSPRVLHFCAEEVVWVCRDYQKSESMDNDETFTYDDEWTKTGYPYTPYGILEKHPRYLWYRTVKEYSRLRLSRGDDKMAALSGLAKQMQDLRLGDRYLVGLWEKTLLLDLLWNVEGYHSAPKSRIARYPTWSWASSPYQVEWESGVQGLNIPLDCTRVEDIKVTNRGPSHMADCVEAKITLMAPLLDASSLLTAYQAREVASLGSGSTARPQPFDHLYPEPYDAVITNLDHLYVSLYKSDGGSFIRDITSAGLSGCLIPLAAGYEFSSDIDAIHVQKEHSSGCYRRVGRATLSHAVTTSYKQWYEFRNRYQENKSTVRRLIDYLPTQRITLI
ncbi:hypothetical protein HER10_EVM0006584 [Colletotrichum scovillei]|uniref:uncharacterized protein n=1 Tax=Colletotrichum scovillei TaxID=1209932 RepID=UPI0015C3864F|nr:uncharacterized protein HER10_EVM0006584 [Colletotrichum scovillei]KAF4775107.1 hypothetical protein HER10_EVM0006584 [Colletotrichum scovillei]